MDISDGWFIARPKREKKVWALRGDEGRRTRKGYLRFLRMSSARGVVRAGVLVVDARPVRRSPLPLTRRWGGLYPLLLSCILPSFPL